MTILAIIIHTIICLDIKNFKVSVSHVTKNYNLFKVFYPILYILLGISVSRYFFTFESSKNLYLIFLIYLSIIVLSLLSAMLSLRYAKFIFSFWCIIASGILDVFLSYILYLSSSKFLYLSGFHIAMYSYLGVITFWLSSQTL